VALNTITLTIQKSYNLKHTKDIINNRMNNNKNTTLSEQFLNPKENRRKRQNRHLYLPPGLAQTLQTKEAK
jgi:hypothetical protein